MAEEYGVFTTSPTATETAAARLFRRFAPSGVVPPGAGHGIDGGDALAVTADGTAEVTVGSGYAIVGGYWYRNTEPLKKAIIPNPGGQSRWDRLVVRADPAEDQCSLEWLEGTPGSSSPPDPTRTTDGIWEEPLCRVLLAPGATSVASGSVVMERSATTPAGAILDMDGSGAGLLAPGSLVLRGSELRAVLADGSEISVADPTYPTPWENIPLNTSAQVTAHRMKPDGFGYWPRYRMLSEHEVELRGVVARSGNRTFAGSGFRIGTLPAAVRPSELTYNVGASTHISPNNTTRLEVKPNGDIMAYLVSGYSPAWISLDNWRYRIQ